MEPTTTIHRRYLSRQLQAKQEARQKAIEAASKALEKILPHIDSDERIFTDVNAWLDRLDEITPDGEQPHLDGIQRSVENLESLGARLSISQLPTRDGGDMSDEDA
jgi:hypothetical protein